MIKEASFRKFNFHPNRDEVQQQFNRFSNYLTRELRKRHRAEHRSSHRNFHTSSSPRQGLDSDQDSLDVPLELRDLLTNTDQVRNSTIEGRHLRYLEEPQLCYKQNRLKLNLQAGHCPLENAAFSRTYSRPTNHRFLKCFAQDHESPPKRRQGLHFQHKNQPPSQSRSNFNTFNKLLKRRPIGKNVLSKKTRNHDFRIQLMSATEMNSLSQRSSTVFGGGGRGQKVICISSYCFFQVCLLLATRVWFQLDFMSCLDFYSKRLRCSDNSFFLTTFMFIECFIRSFSSTFGPRDFWELWAFPTLSSLKQTSSLSTEGSVLNRVGLTCSLLVGVFGCWFGWSSVLSMSESLCGVLIIRSNILVWDAPGSCERRGFQSVPQRFLLVLGWTISYNGALISWGSIGRLRYFFYGNGNMVRGSRLGGGIFAPGTKLIFSWEILLQLVCCSQRWGTAGSFPTAC